MSYKQATNFKMVTQGTLLQYTFKYFSNFTTVSFLFKLSSNPQFAEQNHFLAHKNDNKGFNWQTTKTTKEPIARLTRTSQSHKARRPMILFMSRKTDLLEFNSIYPTDHTYTVVNLCLVATHHPSQYYEANYT